MCSPLASSPPPPSATPPCGEASHPRQQHATSTPWCMGPASVDAMLTFPRPLLCCCSCFRPPGTAPVRCVDPAFPSLPHYIPRPSACVPCTLSCAGGLTVGHMHARGYAWGWLASRRRVRPGRVWWGFFPRFQEVSVRYIAFPFPSPPSFSWLGCRAVLNPGFLHTAVSSPFPCLSSRGVMSCS